MLGEDPAWQEAVAAIDTGDRARLDALLAAHPALARDRLDDTAADGEAYFEHPYLVWFVAENPVRTGTLPPNIVELARTIIAAARRAGTPADQLAEQLDGALELVATGRVPRERGVQPALLDVLLDAGANPARALAAALPHRELDAARHLLARGAPPTLAAAAAFGRADDVRRLGATAGPAERHAALICAAINGQPASVRALVELGVAVNAYGANGYHPHATALHQAVFAGSRETVEILVAAGANPALRDRAFDGTPLAWAEHAGDAALAAYLRTFPH